MRKTDNVLSNIPRAPSLRQGNALSCKGNTADHFTVEDAWLVDMQWPWSQIQAQFIYAQHLCPHSPCSGKGCTWLASPGPVYTGEADAPGLKHKLDLSKSQACVSSPWSLRASLDAWPDLGLPKIASSPLSHHSLLFSFSIKCPFSPG